MSASDFTPPPLAVRDYCPRAARDLQADGIEPLVARALAARGVSTRAEITPPLAALPSPAALSGASECARILADAIAAGESIFVCGDFDADGVTATALAAGAFAQMGAKTRVADSRPRRRPRRLARRRRRSARRGARVLVSVDCGVDSEDGIARARELGLSVCITDHHPPKDGSTTAANCVVHPRGDGAFAGGNLAGVGVAFYAAVALRAELRARNAALDSVNLADWLDLVALGTVADCAPLDFVIAHWSDMESTESAKARDGREIDALFAISGRDPARAGAIDMSMAVAPRINAAVASAAPTPLCAACSRPILNPRASGGGARCRQRTTQDIAKRNDRASFGARAKNPAAAASRCSTNRGTPALSVWRAGTLADRRRRPAFVFTDGGDGQIKGRALAVGIRFASRARRHRPRTPALLASFGGHARAAGVALARADFDRFVAAFESHCRAAAFTPPPIEIDSPRAKRNHRPRRRANRAHSLGRRFRSAAIRRRIRCSERARNHRRTHAHALANGSEKYWATRFRAAPAGRPRINALYQIEPDNGAAARPPPCALSSLKSGDCKANGAVFVALRRRRMSARCSSRRRKRRKKQSASAGESRPRQTCT